MRHAIDDVTAIWRRRAVPAIVICFALAACEVSAATPADAALERIGMTRGVCAVLGLPDDTAPAFVAELATGSELTVYFQSPEVADVAAVRAGAEAAGVLGTRVFVDQGGWTRIHLADNVAGALLVSPAAERVADPQELLRAVHPGGKVIAASRETVKPQPEGVDWWTHPYHGPDNNPQSTDQLARAPYLTQFLAEPLFCPMPEISVAAGGRVFRAFGHIAHKANQNAMLNTLICANAFNGTILWQRPLPPGFMIHRNTMVATADTLLLADHISCKVIDATTGEVRDEIVVPDGVADGKVWKWMALVDGVLYALVGGPETPITTQPSNTPGLGHWPWGMWQGHDYKDPKTAFGFGRTLLAIDPASKKVLWHRTDDNYIDSRGLCMVDDRIFFYCPEKRLGCVDASTGELAWSNTDADLLAAIGPNDKAQHYATGYSTTTYIKGSDRYLFFAGPQRKRLVVASASDGRLVWQRDQGNFQLVLRSDGLYAAGPQQHGVSPAQPTGFKFGYDNGTVLAQLPMRRACTRATGSVDSIFFRASGGTVRIDTATNQANHIAPMRPPCQDGVIISDGNLYWGPWMCGCQLSLYGHICLTSAGDFDFQPEIDASRLRTAPAQEPAPFEARDGDWPTYQGDDARSCVARTEVPVKLAQKWTIRLPNDAFPTAPVAAGGLVFVGDRNGSVRAIDGATGEVRWRMHTGGAIYFPPAVDGDRLFVGSADGRVYAMEAATGRTLWTFDAAPAPRWIPVYGKLVSTWPVAGGVVARDGVVYAAAGIAHYDGTYVYALDAATGKVRWANDRSGVTSEKMNHGVSVQGSLSIRDGQLRMLAGGVHEEAAYDLQTGKCLNAPHDAPNSMFHTAFYAHFPEYGRYVSVDHRLSDGTVLRYDAAYEGSWHGKLMRLPAGTQPAGGPKSRWGVQWQQSRRAPALWQLDVGLVNAVVISEKTALVAGATSNDASSSSYLAAGNVADGKLTWRENLPGPVVKGGLAIDHDRRVYLTLESGRVLAYVPAQ